MNYAHLTAIISLCEHKNCRKKMHRCHHKRSIQTSLFLYPKVKLYTDQQNVWLVLTCIPPRSSLPAIPSTSSMISTCSLLTFLEVPTKQNSHTTFNSGQIRENHFTLRVIPSRPNDDDDELFDQCRFRNHLQYEQNVNTYYQSMSTNI